MELILKKSKADAFFNAMEGLAKKFNNRQLSGKLEDFVNLTVKEGNLDLEFIHPVPEMVRIACCTAFVDTLL